jgi:hypothetical protein
MEFAASATRPEVAWGGLAPGREQGFDIITRQHEARFETAAGVADSRFDNGGIGLWSGH